jgi:hypothetical protein
VVHAVVLDVPAPVEMYDAIHAELLRHDVTSIDGLILHLGRSTAEGFQVVEVWESAEQYERYNHDVVGRSWRTSPAAGPSPHRARPSSTSTGS